MMGKNLYVINTAFGLLNAQAHLRQLNVPQEDSYLLLLIDDFSENLKPSIQIFSTLEQPLWGDIKILNIFSRSFFGLKKVYCLVEILVSYREKYHLFLHSAETPVVKYLIKLLKWNSLTVLDDGLLTISLSAKRLNNELEGIGSLTYYTQFNLKLNAEDKLIKVNPAFMKAARSKSFTYEVVFFGQPLALLNYLPKEYYFRCLERFAEHVDCDTIAYVPHPLEDTEALHLPEGFQVTKLHSSPENIALTEADYFTSVRIISSFSSTVLLTLPKLFNSLDKVIILNPTSSEQVADVYQKAMGRFINYLECCDFKNEVIEIN